MCRLLFALLWSLAVAPAYAALIVTEQAASWPASPIIAGATNTQDNTERDVRFNRDLFQTFTVSSAVKLEKAYIEYEEGVVGKEVTLRIFKVTDVNAATHSVPGTVDLSLVFTTTAAINTGNSVQAIMEFSFTGADQITLTPQPGAGGYAFQLMRTGTGSTTDDTAERAFKWHFSNANPFSGGRGYQNYGTVAIDITANSDFTLALVASPVPEPGTFALLACGAMGSLGLVRQRRRILG